jgi:glutamine amidotransferase
MISPEIIVIDYGIGNVKSMLNALETLGVKPILTNDRELIINAKGVILPGVGAFKSGMENLKQHNLIQVITDYISIDKPFLGVCLGMQMLLDESEEFETTKGLGFIKGKVTKLEPNHSLGEKLPHVSWNEIKEPSQNRWNGTILEDTEPMSDVYFVHSYAARPEMSENILATAQYGNSEFCAAVYKNRIFGTQFHPEKSGVVGLKILEKFIELTKK